MAVLVGRNGAGKSAILEGFVAIASRTVNRFFRTQASDIESIPKILEVEILTPTDRRLQYRYELVVLSTSADGLEESGDDSSIENIENIEEIQLSWNDCCQYLDQGQEVLWRTDQGETTFSSDKTVAILGHTSLLRPQGWLRSDGLQVKMSEAEAMEWVYSILSKVRLLGKTPIRLSPNRYKFFLSVSNERPRPSPSVYRKLSLFVRQVLRMDSEELNELGSICQRIGLGNEIAIQKYLPSGNYQSISGADTEEYLASVLLDGINIGLLSDGTLRVLDLLLGVITSRPGTTTMIEEPETQIHPGLLEKLLNEIKAYTADENLIISTHSLQVVSWVKEPDKINMVDRQDGRTYVRKLKETEIESVFDYLNEAGSLGEWLYSGGLDD